MSGSSFSTDSACSSPFCSLPDSDTCTALYGSVRTSGSFRTSNNSTFHASALGDCDSNTPAPAAAGSCYHSSSSLVGTALNETAASIPLSTSSMQSKNSDAPAASVSHLGSRISHAWHGISSSRQLGSCLHGFASASSANLSQEYKAGPADFDPFSTPILHVALEYSLPEYRLSNQLMFGGMGLVVSTFLQHWPGPLALVAPLYKACYESAPGQAAGVTCGSPCKSGERNCNCYSHALHSALSANPAGATERLLMHTHLQLRQFNNMILSSHGSVLVRCCCGGQHNSLTSHPAP